MFTRTPKAPTNGSSLKTFVDGVYYHRVVALFGQEDPNGYEDEEKGYDGREFRFTETSTGEVVNLYSRFGCWRVGGFSKEAANRFAEWLISQIGS